MSYPIWNGIPLVVDVSGADTHDSTLLQPLVGAIPPVKSRRGPRRRKPGKLRADKGYDYDVHRRWLRAQGIVLHIARRGIDRNDRLGRYRWKIERTLALLTGYRRLTIRYARDGEQRRRIPPPRRTHLLQETPPHETSS